MIGILLITAMSIEVEVVTTKAMNEEADNDFVEIMTNNMMIGCGK